MTSRTIAPPVAKTTAKSPSVRKTAKTTTKPVNGREPAGETLDGRKNDVKTLASRMGSRQFEAIVPKTLEEVKDFARVMVAAQGGDPTDGQSLASMTYVILKGMEIGLLPGEAASNTFVSNGRITISAELQRARVFASGLCAEWNYQWNDKTRTAHLRAKRSDTGTALELRLHLDDFKHLMISNSDSAWAHYPVRMIWARISGYMVRDLFPDVLHGVMTYEEAEELERRKGSPEANLIKGVAEKITSTAATLESEFNAESDTEPEEAR